VTPDHVAVVLNAAILAAVLQAAGGVFFLRLFGTELDVAAPVIRRLVCVAACAGVVLVLVRRSIEAARFAGEFAGVSDVQLQQLAWTSRDGWTTVVQAVALAAIAIGVRARARRSDWVTVLGAIAACAFAATGHASAHDARAWLVPLLAVHALAAAFWFGSLAPLSIAVRDLPVATTAGVVAQFSRLARTSVIALALAGIAVAVTLSPDLTVLDRPYGVLLGVKAVALVVLIALALVNRTAWLPRLVARQLDAARALRRTIVAELGVMALVLCATALLTTLFSPDA